MTEDKIIELARQAWNETGEGWTAEAWFAGRAKSFQRFAELVAAEERNRAINICRDRAATYDKPEGERSMENTVAAFNLITGHNLKEADGWLLMQVLKDVRQWSRPSFHRDSAEDCVAYSAIKAEALANE